MVGKGVVLDKGGNDETVLEGTVVVDVEMGCRVLECSVGGVIRGLGEARGWFWDVCGKTVTKFG